MTRSESKQQLIRDLGGRPVVGDALDGIAEDRVQSIRSVVNPNKLAHLDR